MAGTEGEELYRKDPVTGEFVLYQPHAPETACEEPEEELTLDPSTTPAATESASPATLMLSPFPKRRWDRKRKTVVWIGSSIGFLIVVSVLAAVFGSASKPVATGGATDAAAIGPLPCTSYAVSARPPRCMTAAEREKLRAAARKAAKQARIDAARAAKRARADAARARAKARARAEAEAAAIARANAWHRGYNGPAGDNLDVYYKFYSGSCADYAINGCWHIQVITDNGCDLLTVSMNELAGGAIVGSAMANQDNVPPRTPVQLELDADQDRQMQGAAPTITCL